MSRVIGLRGQLIGGISLILGVATVTAGAIAYFSTRAQVTEAQVAGARQLGRALAALFSLGAGEGGLDDVHLQHVIAAVAREPIYELDLVDVQRVVRASARRRAGERLDDPEVSAALRRREQVATVREADGVRLVVAATPVVAGGRVRGVVRTLGTLGYDPLSWPLLFWLLLAVDGLMLVLFVALVLARYVLTPLEAMRQAAARVTGGDLTTRLAVDGGSRELTALAGSFNAMTAAVQQQLARLDQQQQELATSREQLIRSEKLASVGRLAAGVAHEVGNPLQGIIGFTEILLGEGQTPEEQQDFLRRIQQESQRIHGIIRSLLDYSRPVEDAVEAVTLVAIVEHAWLLVNSHKRLREVSVVRHGLEELPAIAANAQRLIQVLVNLLLNAGDAMAGQGTLTLEGRVDEAAEAVELRVANSGPPIPPEHRSRIFDPFFTTKEPGHGTGLGLSVAQSIVESYGGRLLLCEDTVQTTFALVLRRFRV